MPAPELPQTDEDDPSGDTAEIDHDPASPAEEAAEDGSTNYLLLFGD